MPKEIRREEVQRLIEAGAPLVEVLPAEEYEQEHIAGAINLPLKQIRDAPRVLDKQRAVIVYCHDHL